MLCFLLQAGTFDLVGTIVYEIDQTAYQSTFYNGTIEVAEAGGPLSVESVFLFSLGVALLVLFGLWVRTQISQLSKVFLYEKVHIFDLFSFYIYLLIAACFSKFRFVIEFAYLFLIVLYINIIAVIIYWVRTTIFFLYMSLKIG